MSNVKYTKELLGPLVANSASYVEVIRKLGKVWAGGTQQNIVRRVKLFGLDTSHFKPNKSGLKPGCNKKSWEAILVINKTGRRENSGRLRRALIESGIAKKCNKCGLQNEWQNAKLTLEVNHKNGNCLDNRRNNLEFLCPNCHSQIPNHRPCDEIGSTSAA